MSDKRLDELTIKESSTKYGRGARIEHIKFSNYKFFHGEFELPVSNENLLVYGENGSGKSSIYNAGDGHRFGHPMSVIPTKVGIHLSGKHGFPPTRE